MSEQQTRRMVFHAPYPLNRKATSASGIRPVRMRDAFEELGYEVWEVTGHASERAAAARRVRKALARGVEFDFCYSESSTMPTSMTEPHHLPTHPLLDLALLRTLHTHGTKVGLFYRDVYWAFDGYGEGLNPAKKQAALAAYRWDLLGYRASLDVLYLPSMLMAPHVPVDGLEMRALPPGHDMPELGPVPQDGLHLFYVGGLGAHYRLVTLAQAVQEVAAEGVDVSFTLCTREDQWAQSRQDYEGLVGGPVQVVHASGAELLDHYAASNVASLFIEPSDYRAFAAPVKLYEYVGQAHPILASKDTLSGEFVEQNDFGWTIPYTLEAAKSELRELATHPELVAAKREHLVEHRAEHSWLRRAQQVAEELGHGLPTPREEAATAHDEALEETVAGGSPVHKVLLVSAAQSIHTARWANALAERGLEVHLASIHPTKGQHYDPRVQLHLLPNPKGTGYLAAAPALRRLANQLRPDVVNTHYASGYGTLARAALAGLDLPHLLSVWGSDVYDFPERNALTRRVLEDNLAAADMLASTSRSMAAQTRRFTSPDMPIAITPFGIDLERFQPAAGAREQGPLVVGTVKSLYAKYGIDTLIKAFALVQQELGAGAAVLRIAGEGPDARELQELAARLGVADSVDFLGAVPHDQVPQVLQGFDVYAALSRLESESFGVAILEAGACGLPVVVSDVSGPAEVTVDGVTGTIVGRDDERAAADALLALLRDPELRATMGEAGREHVTEEYSWQGSVDSMLDAYRRTVARHRG